MILHSIVVRALWDEEAQMWTASSQDIDGLSVEADQLEKLRGKVEAAVQDLAECNGLRFAQREVPIHLMATRTTKITLDAA